MTDQLGPASRGRWVVRHVCGSFTVWDLTEDRITVTRTVGTGARMPRDGEERLVSEVLSWPAVGERARVRFADGEALRTTECAEILKSSL